MLLPVSYVSKIALTDVLKGFSSFFTIIPFFLTKPVKARLEAISQKFAAFLSVTDFIRFTERSVHSVHRTSKDDRANIRQCFSHYTGFVIAFGYFGAKRNGQHKNISVSGLACHSKQLFSTFGVNRSAIEYQVQRRFLTLVMTIIEALMTAKILFCVRRSSKKRSG